MKTQHTVRLSLLILFVVGTFLASITAYRNVKACQASFARMQQPYGVPSQLEREIDRHYSLRIAKLGVSVSKIVEGHNEVDALYLTQTQNLVDALIDPICCSPIYSQSQFDSLEVIKLTGNFLAALFDETLHYERELTGEAMIYVQVDSSSQPQYFQVPPSEPSQPKTDSLTTDTNSLSEVVPFYALYHPIFLYTAYNFPDQSPGYEKFEVGRLKIYLERNTL